MTHTAFIGISCRFFRRFLSDIFSFRIADLVLLTGYTFFKLYIFVLKEDNSYCLQSLIHFRFRIIAFSAIAEMLREGSADVFKHFRNRYFINAMRWFNGVCEIFRSCVNTSGCYKLAGSLFRQFACCI